MALLLHSPPSRQILGILDATTRDGHISWSCRRKEAGMATGEEIRKFWSQTQAALAKVDMDARVELVESNDPFIMEGGIKTRTASRVILSSFEGRRIRAWYTVPSGHPPARGWPAILEVPGYGGILPLPIHLVQYGYATLTLYPRGQGESRRSGRSSTTPGWSTTSLTGSAITTAGHTWTACAGSIFCIAVPR